MAFLKHLNMAAGLRDLRGFLAERQRHQWGFALLAVVITVTLVLGFLDGRGLEAPYKREITYVQDWPLDRSLAQIRAQNELDARAKAERQRELEALQAKRRSEFKKVDDALDRYGF